MSQKFTPVTDEAEIEELLEQSLDKPYPHKPNGHLWVDSEDYRKWRAARNDPGVDSL